MHLIVFLSRSMIVLKHDSNFVIDSRRDTFNQLKCSHNQRTWETDMLIIEFLWFLSNQFFKDQCFVVFVQYLVFIFRVSQYAELLKKKIGCTPDDGNSLNRRNGALWMTRSIYNMPISKFFSYCIHWFRKKSHHF